ncbi:hypothetical protein [Caldiplasma sukawensis]
MLNVRILASDQVQTLKLPVEKVVNNLQVISNEDMISEIKLSEKRKKPKQEIQKEKDKAKNEMRAFGANNPKRILDKVIDNIYLSPKPLDRADVEIGDMKLFNWIGQY